MIQRALTGHVLNEGQKQELTKLAPGPQKNFVNDPRKPSSSLLKFSHLWIRSNNNRNNSSSSSSSSSNDDDDDDDDDYKNDGKPFADVGFTVTNDILKEEMEYVEQKMQDWFHMTHEHTQRKRNQKQAQKTNTAIDCMCCYDSFSIDDMCACREEGHLFCIDCLKAFAHGQIFGCGNLGIIDPKTKKPAMELQCFYNNCKSGFSRDILEKALPQHTLIKYDELQFQISIQTAELPNLVTCPKCQYTVELVSSSSSSSTNLLQQDQQHFCCPMEDCGFESCRHCGLEWHGTNISCDEARRREHSRSGLHSVEEAMTLAKVRSCPKCYKVFVKESGCNKIQCCGCNTLICYVCRQVIPISQGYKHFCQVPHCTHENCGKCQLWTTNDKQVDETAMRQAGLQAAQADGTVEHNVVDQLLNNNNNKKNKKKNNNKNDHDNSNKKKTKRRHRRRTR